MSENQSDASTLDLLETRIGSAWPGIRKARNDTSARRKELGDLFRARNSPDTSVVVFGSVARMEITYKSDLDWILLIDGSSLPEHKQQEREIEEVLAFREYIEPGKSGVFREDGGQS